MDHQPIEEEKWGDVFPSQTKRLVISEAVHKLFYGRGRSRGSGAGISVILLSSLMITVILRSFCDQAGGNHAKVSPLVFTDGEDTGTFGGIISANRLKVKFAGIWLAVESDIVITQLVNITNTDLSDHALKISVGAEDFGSELSSLKIYLVSPFGKETLVLEIDD